MTVAELRELLENCPPEAKILSQTRHGTLVLAHHIGTKTVIPTHVNENLIPGNEWRVPTSSADEPETERETHFVVF